MRLSHAVVAVAAVLAVPAAAFACDDHAQASIKHVKLEDAIAIQKSGTATFVDANNQDTRAKYGIVAGAKLITLKTFEPAKELGDKKDAKFIFYCANEKCGASVEAAKKAVSAGYTDVNVMKAGIMGWKKAGAPVETPRS
ncbi:MAG: rhodanese-like domain-containing protein [Myxococcaceae bacterium]|nr:rhodanese-like domain-containing protein [Myxococcaceae bacterium]